MANKNPRPWFFFDADLWTGTTWYERLVGAYLRHCAGPNGEDNEVVLRSVKRIAAETKLSPNKVGLTLKKFLGWPDQFDPFIKSWEVQENKVVLRPRKGAFAKYPTWLWESPILPLDLKDVLMFVRSQFRGKLDDGQELFACNQYGRKEASILRCCYLKGTNWRERKHRLKVIVQSLRALGLITVHRRATSRAPMIVLSTIEIPKELEHYLKVRTNTSPAKCSAETTAAKCSAKPHEVLSGNHRSAQRKPVKCSAEAREVLTSQSTFTESVVESASSEAVGTLPGTGEGHFIDETKMVNLIRDESSLITFLKWCTRELDLERGDLAWEAQAKNLVWLVNDVTTRLDCIPGESHDFLVSHFLNALDSKEWGGIYNLGLRLSKSRHSRMFQECIEAICRTKERDEYLIINIFDAIQSLAREKSMGLVPRHFTMDCEPWTENADIYGQRENWLQSRLEDYEQKVHRLPEPDPENESMEQDKLLATAYDAAARHIWANRHDPLSRGRNHP